jgi:hypothetical protein
MSKKRFEKQNGAKIKLEEKLDAELTFFCNLRLNILIDFYVNNMLNDLSVNLFDFIKK